MQQIEAGNRNNPAYVPGVKSLGIRPLFTDVQVDRIRAESACRANLKKIESPGFIELLLPPIMRRLSIDFPAEVRQWLMLEDGTSDYWLVNINVVSDEFLLKNLISNRMVVTFLDKVVHHIQFFSCLWFLPKTLLEISEQIASSADAEKFLSCKEDYRCLWDELFSAERWTNWQQRAFDQIFYPFKQLPRDFESKLSFGVRRDQLTASLSPLEWFVAVYQDFSQYVMFFYYGLLSEIIPSQQMAVVLFAELDPYLKSSHISRPDKVEYVQTLLNKLRKDQGNGNETLRMLEWMISESARMVSCFLAKDRCCRFSY
jgi:hypothetical protein